VLIFEIYPKQIRPQPPFIVPASKSHKHAM